MAKIFIATPAFTGMTHVLYSIALAETSTALTLAGHQVVIRIHSSGSLLVMERNSLNEAFLKSDCTYMLCIDSDMGWRHESVLTMINHNEDFVAGCYPIRKQSDKFHFQPCLNDDGSLVMKGDLIKMLFIPAGFMLIKRNVIEKMTEHFKELNYEPVDQEKQSTQCALFNTEVRDGALWGEDYVFCRHAREAGFDIWVDPRFGFNHAGTIGCLSEFLTQDKEKWEQSQKEK